MTLRDKIEAMLRKKTSEPHPKGPKYLYYPSGTVNTKDSGGAGTPGTHKTRVRVLNPRRRGKY